MANKDASQEQPGFTFRAVIIAVFLSLFLLMSTSYIALKLGAAPWPIIFAVIVSASVIKILNRGKTINIHEVNVAQAGGSIGGLVAAGVVFTLPGILYLNQNTDYILNIPDPWMLGLMIASAGVLGLILSVPLKYTFIDEEKLPYPSGTAGAELINFGQTGGRKLIGLIIIGAIIGVLTLVRDLHYPSGFIILAVSTIGISLTLLPLPIAVAAGYILGPRAGFSWFSGAIAGWLILVPVLSLYHIDPVTAAAYTKNLGMGMVLGSGVSFFVGYVLPRFKLIFLPILKTGNKVKILLGVTIIGGLLSLLLSAVPFLAAIMTLIGVWAMVAIAARMTGETNIDPLEQFGIFITILIAAIYGIFALSLPLGILFLIAAFVSVSCAIAGDAGHDYKSAAIIGTRFYDIVKIDFIIVIITGFAAPFVFEIFRRGFADQLFTPAMPAPQARLVADSISGFEHPDLFLIGFLIAFSGEAVNKFLPRKYKDVFLWMPFGIGLFLGPGLAIPIAVGAVIYLWVKKYQPESYQSGIIIAATIMGAEGIAGFSAGALTISGLSYANSAQIMGGVLVVVFVIAVLYYIGRYKKNI
jgi:uncharacterized oligopeptide transporter (OPT) family protein